MLLVVGFEKNYIRETILCLLVGGEYMGVLPGPPGQSAKTKHHSLLCGAVNTSLFLGLHSECSSWLTLQVKS